MSPPLGTFGGSETPVQGVSGGTGLDPISDFIQSSRDGRIPSPEGEPALSGQLSPDRFGFGDNMLINSSFESWGTGTTSAALTGTISSSGTTVTGAGGSTFLTDYAVGDYVHATATLVEERITAIASDTSLTTAKAFTPVIAAGSAYKRTRFAVDGWTLTGAGALQARNATNVQQGLSALDLTAALNTATDLAQSITISATQNTRLRNRVVTLSARVRATTASRVFLRLDDGVKTKDSAFHPGDSAFQTLVVSMTLDGSATKIEASVEISSGASITATVDAMKLEEGNQATSWTPNVRDLFVQPRYVSNGTSDSTTTTTNVEMLGMHFSNVILDGTLSVVLFAMLRLEHSSADQAGTMGYFQDHDAVPDSSDGSNWEFADAGEVVTLSKASCVIKPAAGIYNFRIKWSEDAAVGTMSSPTRTFGIMIIPSA